MTLFLQKLQQVFRKIGHRFSDSELETEYKKIGTGATFLFYNVSLSFYPFNQLYLGESIYYRLWMYRCGNT